tara:strand:+ start:317 stop:499 length:183 start_codon:yes stop_codon:yes gene_type:complete
MGKKVKEWELTVKSTSIKTYHIKSETPEEAEEIFWVGYNLPLPISDCYKGITVINLEERK